jgi:hypothetical protein
VRIWAVRAYKFDMESKPLEYRFYSLRPFRPFGVFDIMSRLGQGEGMAHH